MLTLGYPAFRLPMAVVEEEMDLEAWGVDLHLGVAITPDAFARLRDEHDAVVIASGLHRELPLGVPGEDAHGVRTALDLLTKVKAGEDPRIGRQVVVIGAGHTAHDAARTCRRLGAEVTILYRGSIEGMPVAKGKQHRTVAGLEAEGIEFRTHRAVTTIEVEDGRVRAVRIVDTSAGPEHSGGRTDGAAGGETVTEVVACDTVVKATGVYPDIDFLPASIERSADGLLVVDDHFETTLERVFGVGTIIGTRKTVGAFDEGLRSADFISRRVQERSS
jgi:NADPH-dependent glutamate synthase beta subunit-like oxidoreductase